MPVTTVELDDSRSIEELQLGGRSPGSERREVKLGYYEARIGSEYEADVNASNLADGAVCMRLKGVRIQFGFISRKIWLARELTEYPCIRKQVIDYEQQHVAVDEELLSIFLSGFRTAFASSLSDGVAVTAPDVNVAGNRIKSHVEGRLTEGRSRFLQLRIPAQMQVERAEKLRSLAAECGPELNLFTRRLR